MKNWKNLKNWKKRKKKNSFVETEKPEVQVEITPVTSRMPRADEIRKKYLTAGKSPSASMWKSIMLKAAQVNYKGLDYDDPTKTFYCTDAGDSDF